MDSQDWWAALALVLVFEGLLPLISPGGWRRNFSQLLRLRDGQLQFFGLCGVLCGAAMLWLMS